MYSGFSAELRLMSKPPVSELLIATHNPGKLEEFRSALAPLALRLRGLNEFPATVEVAETGETFAENAILKATSYAAQTRCRALADDSGLEVEALGGAPGIFSARYGGEGLTDSERIRKLLDELARTGDQRRLARFTCVIAVADPEANLLKTFTGECQGHIADAPRGAGGFGYDPIFIPDGYVQSFGELSSEIKQTISHRARALEAARSFLLTIFQTNIRPGQY